MTPLRHIAATLNMRAPKGVVGPHIELQVAFIDGSFVSRWEPSPAELAMLNAGGSVELWVLGHQPPVMLQAVPHVDIGESVT
jgi:hypothetical protein